jgi:NADH:ubiquinone oxidoreductase subunit F (NADH-binding)/(2Fe-2S) ferredoxin
MSMKIVVGSASCGISAGARAVEEAAIASVKELNIDAAVSRTGCVGFCQREPLVDIVVSGMPKVSYGNMTASKIKKLLESYAKDGKLKYDDAIYWYKQEEIVSLGDVYTYPEPSAELCNVPERSAVDFFQKQHRVILRNCGLIDPMTIEEAISRGAYKGATRAITQMTREQVINEVTASGLRGRGGAGFPAGRKWQTAHDQNSDIKYFICNADEGDPGAFMDRSIMESDPHAVLEGLMIGAYAIGATQGYIYVRSEYPLAVLTMQHAIEQAEKKGIFGDNIFGTKFSLHVEIRRGAGAFVCGEETALIASIEGRAGEPRPRPPFPAVSGLWGKPTVINNVKTLSSIGPILSRGAEWYSGKGTENNKGTTVFSLVGAVKNTGLVEVPLGISLRDMVYKIGGGTSSKNSVKAVQTGGPSGGCIPESMFDIQIDYEKLGQAGAMMGSGGMIVIDSSTCMVDLAKFFIGFTADESCGKCTPCREGTKQMLHILTRICEGKGVPGDIVNLEKLATTVRAASLCALGGTAPNPVLTALKYFRSEFEAHVNDKKCPAGVCRELITFTIDKTKCTGCGLCKTVCSAKAITGDKKQAHVINTKKCTRCGACKNICSFDAVNTK